MRRELSRLLVSLAAAGLVGLDATALVATSAAAADAPPADRASLVGSTIEAFALPDVHGQTRALADFAQHDVIVVAFLGTECPLAKLYAPRLQQLSAEYASRGVAFLAIDANDQDTLTEIAAFARSNDLAFPLLKDRDQQVADLFQANRNPIAFVLDRRRQVRYQGRIDDQYGLGASSGYARPQVKRRDLGIALDEVLAGKPVSIPVTPVTGCLIGRRPRVAPTGEVTYARHIARILENRCVSCHRPGEIGPFSLRDYDEVVGWSEMLREVVRDGRMPPWSASPDVGHFSNDPRLTDEEKQLLDRWIDNGCPQGDPADLPEPRQWVEGWQIPEPDQVIRMPKAKKVPAEGVLSYEYVLVDPGWKEDKWIQAAEVRPGNRAVVHHILTFVITPASRWRDPKGAGAPAALTSFVPGSVPHIYRPGMAVYVPAHSRIMFEIHYTPNGKPQEDQSYLGVVFAEPGTVKRRVDYQGAENRNFTIPPRARDHALESVHEFKTDQLLLSLSPHMHLRGKAFSIAAHYPDGTVERLLEVPKYDFNWQLRYDLVEPKRLPAVTKLVCQGRFDNSAENLANPDPDAELHFGWQTWDEMMTGFFVACDAQDLPAPPAASEPPSAAPPPAASPRRPEGSTEAQPPT
ncbi:MAG: redoxin domain-containing protein [Planctomycetaceae bacterium]|nr:redoxin domain-containing protein [Planctomycetaceae bacterium]